MSDFRVIVTVPLNYYNTASAVGRAMDIDVGGADSFVERDGQLVAQTWANEAFARMFQYLISNPIGLAQAISADYDARWPEFTAPSTSDVQAFCEAAVLTIDPPL